jgi:hypothetical protein
MEPAELRLCPWWLKPEFEVSLELSSVLDAAMSLDLDLIDSSIALSRLLWLST